MNSSTAVLYSDDSIIAVDKPAGVLAIPDRYDPDAPVLASILRAEWGRLLVVHRIDKDTTGVLLYARTEAAHRALNEAFAGGAVKKAYRGLVRGLPAWDQTSCELPLRADGDRQHRTVVDAHRGKESRSSFTVVQRFSARGAFGGAALVEARPETGRTHQIRVHLAALGFPCLCDPLYGDGEAFLLSKIKRRWKGDEYAERPLLARAALHAVSVEFAHPVTGAPLRIEAPLPRDMAAVMKQLERLSE